MLFRFFIIGYIMFDNTFENFAVFLNLRDFLDTFLFMSQSVYDNRFFDYSFIFVRLP